MIVHDSGKNNIVQINPKNNYNDGLVAIFKGNNCKLIVGDNCTLTVAIEFSHDNQTVVIGNCVTLTGAGVCLGSDGCSLKIGDYSTIFCGFNLAIIGAGSGITIGKNCLFSNTVTMRTHDAHYIFNKDTRDCINMPRNITIGNHVWVCEHAAFLKGANIGDDSVVGAYSVITGKSFPPNSIVAGNPAKVTKSNITWDVSL